MVTNLANKNSFVSQTVSGQGTKMATVILALSMFVTGACGLIYEYLVSTVSTYILGNSIEQFSVIIGLMMFMMAVAGGFQRLLNDNYLVEKFVFTETLLALFGGFAAITIHAAFGLMEDHFNLILYGFVLIVGFLIGLEIPLAMRINEKYVKSLGTNIASIWSFDYVGSLVGSLLFALVLIKMLPLTEIGFLIAFANLFVAILTFAFFAYFGLVSKFKLVLLALVATAFLLGYGAQHNISWSSSLEQKLYDSPIVFSQTTRYQRLVMTHSRNINEYRFYINGNLQFSSADEFIYHEQLVHPIMSLVPDHQNVLVLGGGDGLALREILKYDDVRRVNLVDLDPDMVKFCSTNQILTRVNNDSFKNARVHVKHSKGVTSTGDRTVYQETGRMVPAKHGHGTVPEANPVAKVNVYNIDADRFVGETPSKWNVVIVDLPDPTSIELAKLYSKEFYMKINRLLSENGMMVIQSTSPYHAKPAYLCIMNTLKAAGFNVMPYHDNVPSFGDWGWILAWKNRVPDSLIKNKINGMTVFSVQTKYLTPEVFRKSLVFGKGLLETDRKDVSTLMRPVVLQRYLDESWKIE